MKLATYFEGLLALHRDGKCVSLRFHRPFRVLSTCPAHGGLAEDLDLVFNHQCCEPGDHRLDALMEVHRHPRLYNSLIMDLGGLPEARGAGLATAANMNNLASAEDRLRDLAVLVLATAGVEASAARAGDPASYYEHDGRFVQTGTIGPDTPGTVNLIVAVNAPLTEGTLVQAVMTATEAKASILQELSIPSRQSPGIATGTGTDQIAVAAPAASPDGPTPLTSAGHYAALGALIGTVTRTALREALALQNQLTANRQRSCARLVERFGLPEDTFIERVAAHLPPDLADLARRNRPALERDPLTVAATAGLLHAYDQITWGVIPASCRAETMAGHGAHVAASASGVFSRFEVYRNALADSATAGPATLVPHAVALGFADKWTEITDRLEVAAARLTVQSPP